jgi:hypothetical protein
MPQLQQLMQLLWHHLLMQHTQLIMQLPQLQQHQVVHQYYQHQQVHHQYHHIHHHQQYHKQVIYQLKHHYKLQWNNMKRIELHNNAVELNFNGNY